MADNDTALEASIRDRYLLRRRMFDHWRWFRLGVAWRNHETGCEEMFRVFLDLVGRNEFEAFQGYRQWFYTRFNVLTADETEKERIANLTDIISDSDDEGGD